MVDDEFLKICKEILSQNKSEEKWAEIESDDMFQTENYEGGYDATEREFCFSYYDNIRNEFWFQLTLNEIQEVVVGQKREIDLARI